MRKVLLALVALSIAAPAVAQVRVRGYVRSDGTYVAPHVRSAPNNSRYDNYSTAPNINPYNGRQGTVDPYRSTAPVYQTRSSPTFSPYTPRGGTRQPSGACTFGTYC